MFRSSGILVAGLALACAARSAAAQDDQDFPRPDTIPPEALPAPARPQEVRLGYRLNLSFPQHIDRDNIASLTMGASDVVHFALQDAADDPWYLRVPKWGGAFAIDSAIRYVSHEYGHLSVFSKAGYHTAVFGPKDTIDTTAPRASFGRMFLNGFNPWDNSAVSVSQEDWDRIVNQFGNDPQKINRFTIQIKGGGLNQEAVNLDRYTDRLLDGHLSFLDTMPFIISGAAVLRYPASVELSDTGDYIDELRDAGLRTTVGRLHTLSALTLLSGSTLAALRGAVVGGVTARGGTVEPFFLPVASKVVVFAPELENYLSQFGPTLKPSVPVRVYGVLLRPSYEQLFVSGKTMGEVGLSARAPLTSFLSLSGSAYRNSTGGTWFDSSVDVLPLSWLALTLGYARGEDYSFHRDIYGASNDILRRREGSLILAISAWHSF